MVSIPHSTAPGMPSRKSARPITEPVKTLIANCPKNNRLRRCPASSSASVVRCRSSVPASLISRLRRSSRLKRMKTKHENDNSKLHHRMCDLVKHTDQGLQGSEPRVPQLDGDGLRCDACCRRIRYGPIEFELEFLEHASGSIHDTAPARCQLQRSRLLTQCGFIGWKVTCEAGEGTTDEIGRASNGKHRHRHRDQHGDTPRQMHFLQPAHDRRQENCQQQGQNHGDDNVLAKIEYDADGHEDEQAICKRCACIALE